MNISKVENGEVMKEFRKKFSYKEYYNEDMIDGFEWRIRNTVMDEDIEAFITNALNQQRELLIDKILEEAQWCPFCGDALDCFGCQVMEDRTMTKRMELLKKEILTKLEGKE